MLWHSGPCLEQSFPQFGCVQTHVMLQGAHLLQLSQELPLATGPNWIDQGYIGPVVHNLAQDVA